MQLLHLLLCTHIPPLGYKSQGIETKKGAESFEKRIRKLSKGWKREGNKEEKGGSIFVRHFFFSQQRVEGFCCFFLRERVVERYQKMRKGFFFKKKEEGKEEGFLGSCNP